MSLQDVLAWYRRWRAKSDEKKYLLWHSFAQTQFQGAEIFKIVGIRQKARTGLKAYAMWLDSGQTGAVWIPNAWPRIGIFVSAAGGYGHGEHHDEEVFYAKPPIRFLDAKYYEAMRRHISRENTAK